MFGKSFKGFVNSIEKVKNFTQINQTFRGDIFVTSNSYVVNGASIMGVFSIDLTKELVIKIESEFIEDINNITRDYINFGLEEINDKG